MMYKIKMKDNKVYYVKDNVKLVGNGIVINKIDRSYSHGSDTKLEIKLDNGQTIQASPASFNDYFVKGDKAKVYYNSSFNTYTASKN